MQRVRAREETPTSGSQTITGNIQRQQEQENTVILHLQAVANPDERRVTWDEEVVDNENMGKKSSKICCIYHKPRQFGESSDESSSSSSSSSDESDSDGDDDVARRLRHSHGEELPNGGEPCEKHAKSKRAQKRKRRPSPNAYERQPRHHQAGKKKEQEEKTEVTKA